MLAEAFTSERSSLTFAILAIASMIAGNFLALLQNNIKRPLTYSSIAHMGYLTMAFLAAGSRGAEAAAFYLVAYFITTLELSGSSRCSRRTTEKPTSSTIIRAFSGGAPASPF